MASLGYPIYDAFLPDGGQNASDDVLDAYAKAEMMSASHYSSTCRMAAEDAADIPAEGEGGGVHGGVVDARLRVHGVQRLRVADASVMPHILSAHLVAATVAIAEKCADMVKEDWMTTLRSDEKYKEGTVTVDQKDDESGGQPRCRIARPAKRYD